jgi:hypothetical protein
MVGHRVVHHSTPFLISDPLTNGTTVGAQIGGRFLPGEGWQSMVSPLPSTTILPAGCIDCTLEFDATNFGGQEGFPFAKDLKWISMGDPNAFGSFGLFRDHPWKMHLVQRADFPSGMEIIWRNGGTDANGGDPGDHRIKLIDTPLRFSQLECVSLQAGLGTVRIRDFCQWHRGAVGRLGSLVRGGRPFASSLDASRARRIIRRHHLPQRHAQEGQLTRLFGTTKGARQRPARPFLLYAVCCPAGL